MKKDIRKKGVEDLSELEDVLKSENYEYYVLFHDVKKAIGNDFVLSIYWNALARHEVLITREDIGEKLASLGMGAALGVLMSYMGNDSLGVAGAVGSLSALTMSSLGLLFNGPSNWSEQQKKQLELDTMKVMYPDLYDLELIFNQADLKAVKESGYDWKQVYVEAHKKYEEYQKDHKYDAEKKSAHEFVEYPEQTKE